MRLAELEPPRKDRLKMLLPGYVCGMNPLAAFSQDSETVKNTIQTCVDRDDMGSFIVVL